MYAYLVDAFRFQSAGQVSVATVFNWLKRRLETRRARQTWTRHSGYLGDLDRHTLEDMGIDVTGFREARPRLASFNPHGVPINVFAGTTRRPIP